MEISRVFCAYFSPGGSTEQAAREFTASFSDYPVEYINLTDYDQRQRDYLFRASDLLIVAAPAYGGRIPLPVAEVLSDFHGDHTPTVLIGTYGNRAYDDTIIELAKTLEPGGFIPLAYGAFICRHTFLSELALGRPDKQDLEVIHAFGKKTAARIRSLRYGNGTFSPVKIPGSYPYAKERRRMPFNVETNDNCFYCMMCAHVCPMRAISSDNPKAIHNDICIRCGACLRVCPAQAKSFTAEPFAKLQDMLRQFVSSRQEPEYDIAE